MESLNFVGHCPLTSRIKMHNSYDISMYTETISTKMHLNKTYKITEIHEHCPHKFQ